MPLTYIDKGGSIMNYRNISAEISDETVTQLIQHVKEIEQQLPFVINLTPGEIRALPKMGDKSIPFVEKSLEFSKAYPELVPPYLDVPELQRDLDLYKKLKRLKNLLQPLTEKVCDTYYAVGAEAFTAARTFYKSTKNASGLSVPGSDTIAEELGKRYKH